MEARIDLPNQPASSSTYVVMEIVGLISLPRLAYEEEIDVGNFRYFRKLQRMHISQDALGWISRCLPLPLGVILFVYYCFFEFFVGVRTDSMKVHSSLIFFLSCGLKTNFS